MPNRDPRRWVFDQGAEVYGWLTWQDTWRGHCGSLVDAFPDTPAGPDILDLGTGTGVSAIGILDRCPDARVTGVDFSPRMLAAARRYLRRSGREVRLVEASAESLPFAPGSFDVVTGHSFLYLTRHPDKVLAEARRVLKPGGRCVFLEPQQALPDGAWRRIAGGARFTISMALWRLASGRAGRFDPASLSELLSHEFEEVRVTEALWGFGLLVSGRAPAIRGS